MTDDRRERARAQFAAGEFRASMELALQALADSPDDAELLVLAGRAQLEEGGDAIEHLRRASEVAPQDAQAWHYLGEALAAEGLTAEADSAFRRALELDPEDHGALTHLGHTSLVAGRDEEGVAYLARAADSSSGASTAAISLVDMYRSFGQPEKALAQARQLAQAVPDDVPTWLDVAELSLQLGDLDGARDAFETLRNLDDVPGHEVYPLHGLLMVEIARDGWERAQELAGQAAAIDPSSSEIAAFVNEQAGAGGVGEQPGDGDAGSEGDVPPPPSREDVDAALTASLAEYRRLHADDRRLNSGEYDG
jgi:Flp pilus assembly protein TadD